MSPSQNAHRVFIAHPFTDRGRHIVDSILRPVLAEHKLESVICLKSAGPGVVRDITSAIAGCASLIAVVIGRNPNVFFEIGFASALGKPCILLSDDKSDAGMLAGSYPLVTIGSDEAAARALSSLLANPAGGARGS